MAVTAVAAVAHPVVRLEVDTVEGCKVEDSPVRRTGFAEEAVPSLVLAVVVAVPEEGTEYPNAVRGDSNREDSDPAADIAAPMGGLAAGADNPAAALVVEENLLVTVDVADNPVEAAGADNCQVVLVHSANPEHSCKYPITNNRHH